MFVPATRFNSAAVSAVTNFRRDTMSKTQECSICGKEPEECFCLCATAFLCCEDQMQGIGNGFKCLQLIVDKANKSGYVMSRITNGPSLVFRDAETGEYRRVKNPNGNLFLIEVYEP